MNNYKAGNVALVWFPSGSWDYLTMGLGLRLWPIAFRQAEIKVSELGQCKLFESEAIKTKPIRK